MRTSAARPHIDGVIRWRSLVVVMAVTVVSLTLSTVRPGPVSANSGGPVVIDGADASYHGSASPEGDLQSGWVYIGAWYRTLTSSVPGTYANNGRVVILGSAPSNARRNNCGGAAFYAAATIGRDVDFVDGAAAVASFLLNLRSGAVKPLLVHIAEQTTNPGAELCDNGLDASEAAALAADAQALSVHVNRGGALFSQDQSYDWLKVLYPQIAVVPCGGFDPPAGPAGDSSFVGLTADHRAVPYHSCFTSSGAMPLPVFSNSAAGAVILAGARVTMPAPLAAGDSGEGGATPTTLVPIDRCEGLCVSRVAGDDRFVTAAMVSRQFWPGESSVVVLATGYNFPDAVVAGPLAGLRKVPVLLTTASSVPIATRDEIRRLKVKSVIVVGGSSVVSPSVVNELIGLGVGVSRLFGSDRYETSAALAAQWRRGSTSSIVMAAGTSFGDQIVAAHLAARRGAPLLLFAADGSVSQAIAEEIRRLKPSEIIIVGTQIPPLGAIDTLNAGDRLTTVTASNVYELSRVILPFGNQNGAEFILASGADFPDALSGVAASAKAGVSLLLTRPDCADLELQLTIAGARLGAATVLGGPRAIFEGLPTLSPRCDLLPV